MVINFYKLIDRLGKTNVYISNLFGEWLYHYKGELDENGQACGFGEAVSPINYEKMTGTWINGKRHGICMYSL